MKLHGSKKIWMELNQFGSTWMLLMGFDGFVCLCRLGWIQEDLDGLGWISVNLDGVGGVHLGSDGLGWIETDLDGFGWISQTWMDTEELCLDELG